MGLMVPRVIVVHWTANESVKGTYNTFSQPFLRGRSIYNPEGVSMLVHIILWIEMVWCTIFTENRIARHCIGLNHLSIGIENVGGTKKERFNRSTINFANIDLIVYLASKNVTGTSYRTFGISKKWNTILILTKNFPNYRTTKIDPGNIFMSQLRSSEQIQNIPLNQP